MLDWQKSISLGEYNTLGLPAISSSFVLLEKISDLTDLAKALTSSQEQFLFLGEGSNIVFRENFSGKIIKVALKEAPIIDQDDHCWYVKVSAGQNWHTFVNYTVDAGMFGLENLALIPGTVGAAPVQNIGAYGLEVSQRIMSITIYDFIEKCQKEISPEICQFAYRNSIFKLPVYSHWLIIAVTFKLEKQWEPLLNYHELAKHFAGHHPTAREIFDVVVKIRKKKLPDPELLGNVGSFFKNPIVSEDFFAELLSRYPLLPGYRLDGGGVKLAAAWLIEKCGFKGRRFGEVGVYNKQALVIVNFGRAKGGNILDLAYAIRSAVYQKFGVLIDIEPRIV